MEKCFIYVMIQIKLIEATNKQYILLLREGIQPKIIVLEGYKIQMNL